LSANIHKNNNIIKKLKEKYGLTKDFTQKEILKRVQPIPLKIMLAQAYLESNNGKSRFAKKGNAFFGIWTYDKNKKGIIPSKRDKNKTHRIESFNSIKDSINRYFEVLNSNIHYKEFRNIRYKILKNHNFDYSKINNKELYLMVNKLNKYSADPNYSKKLIDIIKKEKFFYDFKK